MVLAEPIKITQLITRLFDILGIRYFVGGSLASSLHGIPRATQDVDLVADIKAEHIDSLVQNLQGEFYIDAGMIKEAIRRKGSFNVIHFQTMFKIDIFILKSDASSIEEINRREQYNLSDNPNDQIFVATAEDMILHKLYWYKLGGSVSERQWDDILGVLQVQFERLDYEYLSKGAQEKSVSELLEKVLDEARQIK
jgi:hypothetical protein